MCSAYGVTPVYIQWSMNLERCLRKFHQESSSPLKNKICHNPNRSEMCTASEFGHCSLLIHLWLLPVRAAWCLPFSLLSHVEIKHPQRGTFILLTENLIAMTLQLRQSRFLFQNVPTLSSSCDATVSYRVPKPVILSYGKKIGCQGMWLSPDALYILQRWSL